MGDLSVILECQLILSASFQGSKQGEIEKLEDFGCIWCEGSDRHTGNREKINYPLIGRRLLHGYSA
jgi:hypothetical protein